MRRPRPPQNAASKRKTPLLPGWLGLLCAFSGLLPALAQDGYQGLMSDLEGMERHFQSPGDPSAPMVQRLTALEQRLFGAPRSGSMVDRLQNLKSAAREMPPPAPGPAGVGANGRNPSPGALHANSGPGWQPNQPAGQAYGANPGAQGWTANDKRAPSKINSKLNSGAGWTPNASGPYPTNQAAQYNQMPAGPPPAPVTGVQRPGIPGANNLSTQPTQPITPPVIPQGAGPPVQGWQPGTPPVSANRKANKQTQKTDQNNPTAPAAPEFSPNEAIPYNRMVSVPMPLPAGQVRLNYTPDALPLLNAFPPNLLRMEPDNTALIARPDYYDEVRKASKGKAIRFKGMPIPVYIQPYPDKGFVNCVVRAFESWETRTDGALRFSQIENPNQARIQVVWKHLGGGQDKTGCLLGAHTILKYTNHGNGNLSLMSVGAVPIPIYIPRMGPKYTVPPQVMEVNLDLIQTKDPAVKYQCLQNIVTHELGHALGLLGHSPNLADIMYPVTDEHSRLSQRDINTVKKLYDQKCDIPL